MSKKWKPLPQDREHAEIRWEMKGEYMPKQQRHILSRTYLLVGSFLGPYDPKLNQLLRMT